MTDQEINVAIAECCGWKVERSGIALTISKEGAGACVGRYDQFDAIAQLAKLPSYTTDLNAMREAAESLDKLPGFRDRDEVRDAYEIQLSKVVWKGDSFHQGFKVINATARQRAEAFLRTVGRWREDVK